MAKYRAVQCDFWRDSFVIRLTPEEKFFYLYIMTNPAARQCGIYELPTQIMAMETGYNQESIIKMIARFEDYGKIKYDAETSEMAIRNWNRYNSNSSPKVVKLVENELETVKNRVLIQYVYGIDTVSIPYRKEKEKEKEKEKYNEKENEKEKGADGLYVSLLSDSMKLFSEQNLEGVFFEKMKHLHGLNDAQVNEYFQVWKKKKEATGQEFKTYMHLKSSFNKFLEYQTDKPKAKNDEDWDIEAMVEASNKIKPMKYGS